MLLEERQKGKSRSAISGAGPGGFRRTHSSVSCRPKAQFLDLRNIGHTRDDAAGEAFDKVAKLLGLGYPGGPAIDRLAPHGDPKAVKFPPAQIKHRDRRGRNDGKAVETDNGRPRFDFSYSGIKTAILRYVETHGMRAAVEARRQGSGRTLPSRSSRTTSPTATSSRSIWWHRSSAPLWKIWWERLWRRLATYDVATLFVTGGVAANQELRQTFEREGAKQGLPVYFPSRPLSTDNAAMIAAAAFPKFLLKDFAAMDFSAEAGLLLR